MYCERSYVECPIVVDRIRWRCARAVGGWHAGGGDHQEAGDQRRSRRTTGGRGRRGSTGLGSDRGAEDRARSVGAPCSAQVRGLEEENASGVVRDLHWVAEVDEGLFRKVLLGILSWRPRWRQYRGRSGCRSRIAGFKKATEAAEGVSNVSLPSSTSWRSSWTARRLPEIVVALA